ncbi:MAG: mandelate racemase/muconate lactonizing enzyme family protein [Bacillota bacterium]|uniref:Mandelate racemase/muconate lactonizing enzyme family protein n=1 Tax=Thermanaerosceptrum fracticalcis TaxID=1712410 RepID=A0A7G6DZC9_THEFR|nr:mandelate racemase/muconate lactonizing enzyme family protein [Thermanaerosceptrum fracticalcis]QNB45183.1 mandelate racemase/muconate lactonizing enzyme family protein [Thermanaerosceptrum fracticalcis]
MRITNVEAISLIVPIENSIKAPISIPHADELEKIVFKEYRVTLVKIDTDEGITGYGECMVRLAPTATRDIVEYVKPLLIGKDPMDTEYIWELLFGTMMNRGHFQGFYIEAISGIDVALWDIKGKALNVPVYTLLGGNSHPKIWAYASSIRFRGMETMLKTAETFVEKGFTAMKIKIGQGYKTDVMAVEAVRKHVGDDITLMVDANCGYDVKTALKIGRELENYNITWFEEPISPMDYDGYRRLSESLDVPIAAGEAHFLRYGIKDLIEKGKVDIIQPNVCRAGGFTECLKIHGLSSSYDVPYLTHTGSSSAVCIAASLQIAAAFSDCFIFEHMQSDWSKDQRNPLRWDLTPLPIKSFSNGFIELEDKPGIGVEINEDVIKKYRV